MASVVNMPRLGLNEEENVLGEWYVKEGDAVNLGDKLFSIETDKSSMDIYAEREGTVLKCLYEAFDVVPVMTGVCILGEPGEDISGVATGLQGATSQGEGKIVPAQGASTMLHLEKPVQVPNALNAKSTAVASPRAKKLAEANGIDLCSLQPSGVEGRIIEEDVLNYMRATPLGNTQTCLSAAQDVQLAPIAAALGASHFTATPGGRDEKTTPMRRLIADNIFSSLRSTAQTTQHMRFNASKLQSYRVWLKSSPGPEKDISLNDIISYVTVKTLLKFDYMNAHLYSMDALTKFDFVNLGFACATPRGLLVPTIKNAQSMTLTTFAVKMKALAQRARDGKILPEEMTDATFTISNMGSYGMTTFTPILNPPQVGILGVGTIDYAVKSTPEGMLYYPSGYLSLTYDHRAFDGVPAIEFFRAVCKNLESLDVLGES